MGTQEEGWKAAGIRAACDQASPYRGANRPGRPSGADHPQLKAPPRLRGLLAPSLGKRGREGQGLPPRGGAGKQRGGPGKRPRRETGGLRDLLSQEEISLAILLMPRGPGGQTYCMGDVSSEGCSNARCTHPHRETPMPLKALPVPVQMFMVSPFVGLSRHSQAPPPAEPNHIVTAYGWAFSPAGGEGWDQIHPCGSRRGVDPAGDSEGELQAQPPSVPREGGRKR